MASDGEKQQSGFDVLVLQPSANGGAMVVNEDGATTYTMAASPLTGSPVVNPPPASPYPPVPPYPPTSLPASPYAPQAPGGWSPWPVMVPQMMPQSPFVIVIKEPKKEEPKKDAKIHSEVVKRP